MNPDIIGWAASTVLLATLVRQIFKQVRDGGDGVSKWLFVGQSLASVGFVIYSAQVGNMVFVVTNAAILATAIIGQCLAVRQRRRQRGEE